MLWTMGASKMKFKILDPGTWFDNEADELSEAEADWQNTVHSLALQEGIDPVELSLAFEDRGWNRTNLGNNGDQPFVTRRSNVLKARLYWLLDPMAAAAVRTWTNYTLGSGITIKAQDAGQQSIIDDFLDDPKNQTMVSAEGQRKHNRRLLVDGEIFFALFNTSEGVLLRRIDCTEITELILDPEDSEVVWAYKRVRMTPDGTKEYLYYRNWAFPDQDLTSAYTQSDGGTWERGKVNVEDDVLVVHLAFDSIYHRGNSLFASSLNWLTHLRQFMEDRISITKGLAKYIQKLTFKGGKKQAASVAGAMTALSKAGAPGAASGRGIAGGVPNAAVRETAKTAVLNDQVDITNMPRMTGAGDSKIDHKLLRLMVCAGTGMTEPYFGDAESGNLASATAMELPMLKQFENHQQLWADCWVVILSIVCSFDAPTKIKIDIDFPPIVLDDVSKLITAIVSACAEFPELKQPEILTLILTNLNINNVDDVMKRVLITAAENQAKADNVAKGLNPDGSKLTPSQALAQGAATPVVAPAKPVFQKTVPGGQPVAANVKEALEVLLEKLEDEARELEEASAAPSTEELA
jgi:hypothetical protein